MSVDVELARQQWADGYRRLQRLANDPAAAERAHADLDVVIAELRRRVGGTYTLAELADAYARADDWVRETIEERAGVARASSLAGDAAFHLYARGALYYAP
jgi:hypothetical protein